MLKARQYMGMYIFQFINLTRNISNCSFIWPSFAIRFHSINSKIVHAEATRMTQCCMGYYQ